jgi:hypothetical protein
MIVVFNGYIKDRIELADRIADFVGERVMRGVYLGFLLWIIGLFFSPTFAYIVSFWSTFFCFFFGICLLLFGLMVFKLEWRKDVLFPACICLGGLLCSLGGIFAIINHIHLI